MRRIFGALLLLGAVATQGRAGTLIDLPGAAATNEVCSKIQTTSGDAGWWCSRSYAFPDGTALQVEAMTGRGPGSWEPPKTAEGGEGALGSGGVCRTVDLKGRGGLLEWHPLLGSSLTVALETGGTLTLESRRIDSEDLLPLACMLLQNLAFPETK